MAVSQDRLNINSRQIPSITSRICRAFLIYFSAPSFLLGSVISREPGWPLSSAKRLRIRGSMQARHEGFELCPLCTKRRSLHWFRAPGHTCTYSGVDMDLPLRYCVQCRGGGTVHTVSVLCTSIRLGRVYEKPVPWNMKALPQAPQNY
jgi:hypothetical protein